MLLISKRDLLISAADKTKLYGAGNPTLTGSISGVQNSDPVSESFTSVEDAASGIGDYVIVLSGVATGAVLANYSVIATNGTLTITKRDLLISAADKTKLYGAGNPTLTRSEERRVGKERVSERFTTVADDESGIGDYAIVPHADAAAAVLANCSGLWAN